MPLQPNSIVDLFSGCGGFSLGAHLAGFETAISVDIDRNLSSSFEHNFASSKAVNWDLSKATSGDFKVHLGSNPPVGVIGGPPCQGFSLIGKRSKHDPRNELVGHFFRHVCELRPKFFVMENVPGILFGDSRTTLEAGLSMVDKAYTIVGPLVIDAAKFGAATNRERVVVLGYLPSEVDPIDEKELATSLTATPATVREAIGDLPAPRPSKTDEHRFDWVKYPSKKGHPLSDYALRARSEPPPGLGWKTAVQHLKLSRVSGLAPTKHSDAVVERFRATARGATERVSRYPKLDWKSQCSTLRAGTGPEKGSFQSMRPIHPESPRVITVREAARIQGFPDWFVFHPTKWHSFRMIGNSVSPFVSEHLMGVVATKVGVDSI